MRKYFLIVAFLTTCHFFLSAQNPESIKRDSLLIDSLQKTLPILKDTARINCLNNIAEGFLNRDGFKLKIKADSAFIYAVKANREATQANYKYGIALSFMNLSHICYFYGFYNRNNRIDNSDNLNKWIIYHKQLFDLASQINDAEIWGMTFYWQSNLMGTQKNSKGELDALEKALGWFKKSGNEMREAEVCYYLYFKFSASGEFEKAFEYASRSLKIAKKLNSNADKDDVSNELIQEGLINMANLYESAGDYESSLDFLRESRQFHAKQNASNTWGMEEQLADMFLLSGQFDSAFSYLKPIINNNQAPIFTWPRFADAFLLKGNHDSALFYYDKAIDTLKKRVLTEGVKDGLMRSYIGKAKILGARNNYNAAMILVKESGAFAQQRGNKLTILNCYDLQSQFFYHLGKGDSAYIYLRKFVQLKDSILTRQFIFRLNNYKKEVEEEKKTSQINLLNKDNQLKEQKLKQQALVKNSLIAGLILLLLLGVFIFRNLTLKRKSELQKQQLENEKKQAELQQRATELEMQALRAQMNPHFIFNCLNSINRFIYKNETKAASDYLTRFSRLIRMVLLHSQKKLVPLEDELEMLRLYLDMERLRFKNAFDYHITTTNAVETSPIFIPPLLLQPFCENAIWHGLMHKDEPGHLNIELSEENNILHCIITDDGVGREKAEEYKSKSAEKEKSMGLKITKERLSLLNQGTTGGTFYEIEDVKDEYGDIAGTKVKLQIRYKESIKEPV